MKKSFLTTRMLTTSALIAAIYVVLTLIFAPISYGEIQVRISEALTILPFFTPAAIPGLFVGCMISNILGGCIIWDILFGSLATLLGALFSYKLRKNRWLVPIPPIVSNTIIIPFVLRFGYGVNLPMWILFLSIAAGEVISCYVLGQLFITILKPFENTLFPSDVTNY